MIRLRYTNLLYRMDRSTFQTLSRLNYRLNVKYVRQKIEITVKFEAEKEKNSLWYAEISSCASSEILSNFFTNLQQLYEHLLDQQNVRVDSYEKTVSILLKTTIRNKQSLIQISKFSLTQGKQSCYKDYTLTEILSYCQKEEQVLANEALKYFLVTIIKRIESRQVGKEYTEDEKYDPLLKKLKIVGQKTQILQNKFGAVLDEIDSLKKDISRFDQIIEGKVRQLKDYIETVKQGIDRDIIRYQHKNENQTLSFKQKLEIMDENQKDMLIVVQSIRDEIQQLKYNLFSLNKYQKPILKHNSDAPVDILHPFFNHFKIQKNTITKVVSSKGFNTLVIGKYSFDERQKFTIRVNKLGYAPLMVGIIDEKHRNQQYCQKTDNRIWISTEGIIFNGEYQRMGSTRFGVNSKIEVIATKRSRELTWRIDGKDTTVSCKLISTTNIKWYPCVWVGEAGDSFTVE